jgi:hypothetical protein
MRGGNLEGRERIKIKTVTGDAKICLNRMEAEGHLMPGGLEVTYDQKGKGSKAGDQWRLFLSCNLE